MFFMNRDFLIKLTNELYQITLLFPKKDSLRYKMRDLGTDILAQLISLSKENPGVSKSSEVKLFSKLENSLTVLISYFEVAKTQNWVSPKDILEIKNQYCKIKESLKVSEVQGKERSPAPKNVLKERQTKILEILKKKGKAQVQEFKKHFPYTSRRTLRRDLRDLLNQGRVERIGERSDTFYRISDKRD